VIAVASAARHPAWHYVVVPAIALTIYAGLKLSERRSLRLRGEMLPLAVASAGAGLVHLGVCPEHFREATVFGVFFLVVAIVQVVWAGVVAVRPSKALLAAGAVASAGLVAIWAMSRAVGVPIGPDRWQPEAIGRADVVATALELMVAALAVRLFAAGSRRTALA
jgi:hypothetical membrane protein